MPEPGASESVTRRRFLRRVGCGAVAGAGTLARAGEPQRGKVAEVIDAGWQTGGAVDPRAVAAMLGRAMRELTGKGTLAAAWGEIAEPGERVGVKFNRVSRNFSAANQALGDAILHGLALAGVRRRDIIVVEAVGADFPGTGRFDGTLGPEADTGFGRTRLTRFVREQVDALINVPDLKHHERCGITGALKNVAFGSTIVDRPWRFHGNGCDPHIAALYALPQIGGKCRLHILNGLRGLFHHGPRPGDRRWQWDANGLSVSSDAVALDAAAGRTIGSERRRRLGLGGEPELARYLVTAARMGLGTVG